MSLKERMEAFVDADLYVVITEAFCVKRAPIEVLAKALQSGVRVVQLREKHVADRDLYRQALEFRKLTAEWNALFIMNDRLDIALAASADGVHLGQDDVPINAARKLAPELIIGCSTHSIQEAIAAQEAEASYVNIGPIFSTQTKTHTNGALGPDSISAVASRLVIPWSVMGGIKKSNIDLVLKKGAKIVSVVTAVTEAEDVGEACTALRKKITDTRKK